MIFQNIAGICSEFDIKYKTMILNMDIEIFSYQMLSKNHEQGQATILVLKMTSMDYLLTPVRAEPLFHHAMAKQ